RSLLLSSIPVVTQTRSPSLPLFLFPGTGATCVSRTPSPRAGGRDGSPLNTPWNTLRQKRSKETTPDRDLSGSYSHHSNRPHDKCGRLDRRSHHSWNS